MLLLLLTLYSIITSLLFHVFDHNKCLLEKQQKIGRVCVYVCEREKVAIKNIYLLCPYIYLQIVMYLIQLLHLIPLLYDNTPLINYTKIAIERCIL